MKERCRESNIFGAKAIHTDLTPKKVVEFQGNTDVEGITNLSIFGAHLLPCKLSGCNVPTHLDEKTKTSYP